MSLIPEQDFYKKYIKLLLFIHKYIKKYNIDMHHIKTKCEVAGEICMFFYTSFNSHKKQDIFIKDLEKLSIMLEGNITYDYKARSILFKFSESLIDIFNDSERFEKFNNSLKNSNKFHL